MEEEHGDSSASALSTEDGDLHLLAAVMQAYADKWDASTTNLLITDVASLGREKLPENWSSKIERMKSQLLFPLAKLLAMEKTRIEHERNIFLQKEQQVISTILTLQEERNNAMQQFEEESDMLARQNMFVETLLRAEHPQTDGQTERVNQTLEDMLIANAGNRQSQWEKYLPLLEFAYNDKKSVSTKKSPFKLNYGFRPASRVTLRIP